MCPERHLRPTRRHASHQATANPCHLPEKAPVNRSQQGKDLNPGNLCPLKFGRNQPQSALASVLPSHATHPKRGLIKKEPFFTSKLVKEDR
jgi:hypothetical protein